MGSIVKYECENCGFEFTDKSLIFYLDENEELVVDSLTMNTSREMDKSKLAGLMSEADLGLQILANIPAFYYGTSPNKFFDYIAAGLPVLNNYPGWLAELIQQENAGFTVQPEHPRQFADALEEAATNRDKLKNMGKNAQALAKREFDRANLAQKFNDWVTGVKS